MTEATLAQTNGLNRVPRGVLTLLVSLFFAGLLVFVSAWSAIVWNATRDAELKNVEQDGRITAVERAVESINRKLDILIERGK